MNVDASAKSGVHLCHSYVSRTNFADIRLVPPCLSKEISATPPCNICVVSFPQRAVGAEPWLARTGIGYGDQLCGKCFCSLDYYSWFYIWL
jgi:hypothetical protein